MDIEIILLLSNLGLQGRGGSQNVKIHAWFKKESFFKTVLHRITLRCKQSEPAENLTLAPLHVRNRLPCQVCCQILHQIVLLRRLMSTDSLFFSSTLDLLHQRLPEMRIGTNETFVKKEIKRRILQRLNNLTRETNVDLFLATIKVFA